MEQMQTSTPPVPAAEAKDQVAKGPLWRRPLFILAGTILMGAAFYLGFDYLAETFTHETTDDAFIDSDVISLAPKVAGQIKQVYVTANQPVKAGELLVELDPRDLQVVLEQKQAAAVAAQANVELLKTSLDLFQTQIQTAEATAKQSAAEAAAAEANTQKAKADLKRSEELLANHTISPQEYDSTKATATWTEANLTAQQEKASSDRSKVSQAHAQFQAGVKAYDRAGAQKSQSDLDVKQAALNLSYTRITAPQDGQVTRKSVQPGNYVQIGQSLLALVPNEVFVTANFKETQLENIRPRQKVKVNIDSVKAGPFSGYVQSIQAGSGSAFSLLPPENAVGNFVKVVQRIPVRIYFDKPVEAGHVLGPGMSVVPSVQITDRTIPEFVVVTAAILLAGAVGVVWWLGATRKAA